MKEGEGLVVIQFQDNDFQREQVFSSRFACPEHGASIEELEPRTFSFNSPFGACPSCSGLGFTEKIIPETLIDMDKSILRGALKNVYATMEFSGFYRNMVRVMAEQQHIDLSLPFKELPARFRKELLYGTGSKHVKYDYTSRSGKVTHFDHPFEGLITNVERRYRETGSDFFKERMRKHMVVKGCPDCQGKRLRPEVLAVTVGGISIADFSDMSIKEALAFIDNIDL
jgi:excinuclease ABC subunit A